MGPGLRGRFVASMAREMMKDVMRERLKEEKYNVDRAAKATREIADSIKTKLKGKWREGIAVMDSSKR